MRKLFPQTSGCVKMKKKNTHTYFKIYENLTEWNIENESLVRNKIVFSKRVSSRKI